MLGPLVAFFGTGHYSGFGAVIAELYPTSVRATAAGVCYNAGRIASAAAPFVVGRLPTRAASAWHLWSLARRSFSRRSSGSGFRKRVTEN